MIAEQRFLQLWGLIEQTWRVAGHCMMLGASRRTVASWVQVVTQQVEPPNDLRSALMEGVRRGWATHIPSDRSYSGKTAFVLGDAATQASHLMELQRLDAERRARHLTAELAERGHRWIAGDR
jgi:hypothetical protein